MKSIFFNLTNVFVARFEIYLERSSIGLKIYATYINSCFWSRTPESRCSWQPFLLQKERIYDVSAVLIPLRNVLGVSSVRVYERREN
jgi:hypothetical protein